MNNKNGLHAVAVGLVFAFVFMTANSVLSQPTGTLVDPSVPAGVAPNPHTLEGAQMPAAGPTPRRTFKKEKGLPPGNKGNHLHSESFNAPVQPEALKPANASSPATTPNH